MARNNFMKEIKLPVQPGLTVYLDDYEEQDPIEGYDRAAWFLDPDFRTPAPAELEAAGQTLYSQRIANRYTIYFSSNGGNGSLPSLPAQWDTPVQLPESTFRRSGYTFASWNTQPRGDGKTYENGAQVTNLAGKRTTGDRITLSSMPSGRPTSIPFSWTPTGERVRSRPRAPSTARR